jgi:hypothetical protein
MGVALIGAAASVIGGAVAAGRAKKAAGTAKNEADRARREISRIKAQRVNITNPYSGNTDLSALAQDLSSMITNPFANLSVATQAANIQIDQSDIALANALDNLATTGASAGGATALAQAALASKKGVSASIETQEKQNEEKRNNVLISSSSDPMKSLIVASVSFLVKLVFSATLATNSALFIFFLLSLPFG